jgi:hypothetical protein
MRNRLNALRAQRRATARNPRAVKQALGRARSKAAASGSGS